METGSFYFPLDTAKFNSIRAKPEEIVKLSDTAIYMKSALHTITVLLTDQSVTTLTAKANECHSQHNGIIDNRMEPLLGDARLFVAIFVTKEDADFFARAIK